MITPDDKTLIVAETFAGQLSAFDIEANGDLTNRRLWARLPEGACLMVFVNAEGGIWALLQALRTAFVRLRAEK